MDLEKLKDPFPAEDIEWRILSSGIKKTTENGEVVERPWGKCYAYIKYLALIRRFDSVCGIQGWEVRHDPIEGGVICKITLRTDDNIFTHIIRSAGASFPKFRPVEAACEDAFRNAVMVIGVGRYLHALPTSWANIHANGKLYGRIESSGTTFKSIHWDPPELPNWALPKAETTTESEVAYIQHVDSTK